MNDGEKIALTDGFNIVQNEKYYLLSLLIGFKTGEIKEAVIPYNFPRIAEKIAKNIIAILFILNPIFQI